MNISQQLRTCAKHTALDAVIELLNEAADEIDALHAEVERLRKLVPDVEFAHEAIYGKAEGREA